MDIYENLGYSSIVDIIQNDVEKGSKLIIEIALEKEKKEFEISQLEQKLEREKNKLKRLEHGVFHILKHLDKITPLAVVGKDFIVVISDKNISVERNVI